MYYKYIKGQEVLMEEHMLSATELAKAYGLLTLNNNPNGLLVSNILADYIAKVNLNVSAYFYPHSHGVMRVYPKIVYEIALNDFIFDLKDGETYEYIIHTEKGKKRVNYKYKQQHHSCTVIPMTGRRNIDVRK